MAGDQERLLSYYEGELSYLRRMGSEFAQMYPKVASRLELGPDGSADPHVERLIEAFAFLTARVQQNLDEQFPEISSSLLDVLYPQLGSPVPAMSVARFDVDPEQGKLTTGHTIPAQTPLFADTRDGSTCRFRTGYPVTLWPAEVTYAGFESTDKFDFLDDRRSVATVLRLQLRCTAGDFSDYEIDSLRFYINGELRNASGLYELLFSHGLGVGALPAAARKPIILQGDAVRPVGFGQAEELLPYPGHAHSGYRLLQEYFAFPRKYLFFDVAGIGGRLTGKTVDLIFMLDEPADVRLSVDTETFCLGCTPIVNLFRKTSEPIRLDHRKIEYRLVGDYRREQTTEIHSIRSVSGSMNQDNISQLIRPFYSYDHSADGAERQAFWHARRVSTGRKDVPGTDILISFLDLDFDPRTPSLQTVFAHTLCTNRRLAEQLPAGALLQTEFPAPVKRISALHRPTQQLDPAIGGAAQWRLISHLSLNYLSLLDDKAGLRGLREILRLYAPIEDAAAQNQIGGIVSMTCRQVVRRLGTDAWRGFLRGTEVTLVFDESAYVGTNAFVFASVLRHFLALYASVNSFTQLIARSTTRETIWKQWPPLAGEQTLL